MVHGDSFFCGCGITDVNGGSLVREADTYNAQTFDGKLVAKFDLSGVEGWGAFDALEGLTSALDGFGYAAYFSPFFGQLGVVSDLVGFFANHAEEQKTCICGVVEDLDGGWVSTNVNDNPDFEVVASAFEDAYETYCVGLCGAHCGRGIPNTKRYGSLIIHDVCQAFIGSTDSMMVPAGRTNPCGDEGFGSVSALLDSLLRSRNNCEDGPDPSTAFPAVPSEDVGEILGTIDGDFDGDGLTDTYENRALGRPDVLFLGSGDELIIEVDDDYHSPVAGDFDDDGSTELLWRHGDAIHIWEFSDPDGPGGIASIDTMELAPFSVPAGFQLHAGDFDGDGVEDLFAYEPHSNSGKDHYLFFDGGSFAPTKQNKNVRGVYEVLVEDFTGDGIDDVFFYSFFTSGPSFLHQRKADRSFTAHQYTPSPGYIPAVLDLTEDGIKDILWHSGAGAGPPAAFVATGNPQQPFILSDLEPEALH